MSFDPVGKILGKKLLRDNSSKPAFYLSDIKANKEAKYFEKYGKKSSLIQNDTLKEAQVAEALIKNIEE